MANRSTNSDRQPDPGFETLFGRPAEFMAEAPGRVNLMGDHTDYNGGYVLPTVIPHRTGVQMAVRPDPVVRVWSANVQPSEQLAEYGLGTEESSGSWVDYVKGLTHFLSKEGHLITGCDVRIDSSIPLGAGLSSSASLEVSVLRAFRRAWSLTLTDTEIATLAHRSETTFVGVPVGLMDHMVCSLGTMDSALFFDAFTLHYTQIPLPAQLEFVVIHSGVSHSHATGSYRQRREECRQAASSLGVEHLRAVQDWDRQSTSDRFQSLSEPLRRRVRHVLTENERVLKARDLLMAGEVEQFGALMYASHESLRSDFEVSTEDIDLLVRLAQQEPEIYGARLTGGGFGGSVVMAVRVGSGRRLAERLTLAYRRRSGRSPTVLLPLGVEVPVT